MVKRSCTFFKTLALLLLANYSVAQSKAITIPLQQTVVDGLIDDILPGDTIFLESGKRGEILFKNLTGERGTPIVIINESGKVVINSKREYGISLENSIHCKLTGTGGTDKYGIEIASSNNHGLVVAEFSTDCEADHLEIHHSAYAGIVAKTDPNCSRKDLRFFIMRNLSFHDNYIHDTFAEGFYVGYSWYPARQYVCGKDSLLYPHQIHSVRIYNNRLENTGQEAIQVGGGTYDVKIYSNNVYNYGKNNELWQNHGVQIGQGTTGDLFNNVIDSGPAEGISLFGGGNNRVYCNTITNTGASAIYQNDRNAFPNTTYSIYNNKISNSAGKAIVMVSAKTRGNVIHDNVIITTQPNIAISDEGSISWTKRDNIITSVDSILHSGECSPINSNFAFEKPTGCEIQTIYANSDWLFKIKNASMVNLLDNHGIPVRDFYRQEGRKLYVVMKGRTNGIYYLVYKKKEEVCLFRVVYRNQYTH